MDALLQPQTPPDGAAINDAEQKKAWLEAGLDSKTWQYRGIIQHRDEFFAVKHDLTATAHIYATIKTPDEDETFPTNDVAARAYVQQAFEAIVDMRDFFENNGQGPGPTHEEEHLVDPHANLPKITNDLRRSMTSVVKHDLSDIEIEVLAWELLASEP
jgi:hypothetical protein